MYTHKSAFLSLLLLSFASSAIWAADNPMVGDWKLNPQKSKLVDEMKVTGLGGNKYTFDFGGTPETIAVDGTDQPGLGGTTLAVTPSSPDHWKVIRKIGGRVEISATWSLSSDGKILQDDYTEITEKGQTMHLVYRYDRQGSGSGFAGDWVSMSQDVETTYLLEVRPYDDNGLTIIAASEGSTKNIKLDGKDYPIPGSKRGVVATAKRIDERTIELADKLGDQVLDTQQITVSGDGKTLTMTIHSQGRSLPNVLVFDKE